MLTVLSKRALLIGCCTRCSKAHHVELAEGCGLRHTIEGIAHLPTLYARRRDLNIEIVSIRQTIRFRLRRRITHSTIAE